VLMWSQAWRTGGGLRRPGDFAIDFRMIAIPVREQAITAASLAGVTTGDAPIPEQ